ncbi:hypothetical protein ACDT12_13165 [Staphylococcus aureus]
MTVDGKELVDDVERAEAFAKYFSSVYVDEDLFVGHDSFQPVIPEGGMPRLQIDKSTVEKKLKDLNRNKSAGQGFVGVSTHYFCLLRVIIQNSLDRGKVVGDRSLYPASHCYRVLLWLPQHLLKNLPLLPKQHSQIVLEG